MLAHKSSRVKILAIVGMCGSGKSTVIDFITEKSVPKIYFGGIILKAMAEAGITDTPDNERRFREEIRAKEGKDFVVRRVIAEAKKLIDSGQKKIILDGLYSWTEYKILREEFPSELTLIAVVMPKALRRKRLAERSIRPFNAEQAALRDFSEIENLEKGGPIAIADYYLDNSRGLNELRQNLDKILDEIAFFD